MNFKSTIQWATPYSLGLLIAFALAAIAGFVVLRLISGRPIVPGRRVGLLAIRLALLAIVALIIMNPVRVDETKGAVELPRVCYLLDASQSMAIGKDATRWDQAIATIKGTTAALNPRAAAQVSTFRFGARLAALSAEFWRPGRALPAAGPDPAASPAAKASSAAEPIPAPTDSDTLLGASLEALPDRFGQTPPEALVVFSDGRTRDHDRAVKMARAYARMNIPIHVVPVGDENVGGDVAIVSMVAPNQVRKHSKVSAQIFVRCCGFDGKRAQVRIVAVAPDGKPEQVLANTPVVLKEGLTSFPLSFESGDQDSRIEARIDAQPGEVSMANNAFGADLAIDHTKIRVLYLEGSSERFIDQRPPSAVGEGAPRESSASSSLQGALMEDPDIECTVVVLGDGGGDFTGHWRLFPESASQFFAYDAMILSNVSRDVLNDQNLAWIEEWVGRRGAGLCMAGGPSSFGSGHWNETSVGQMLPVELAPTSRDWDDARTNLEVTASGADHPIWHLSSDEALNQKALKALPSFLGNNRLGPAKQGALVLAQKGTSSVGGQSPPAIVVQPFGRGRTMAMSTGITRRWAGEFSQSWGGGDARYYKKFWRNVVYWLTENSSIGRRRLLAETDKRLYRPGEPINLRAHAFDENAAPTLDYRVAVTIDPRSAADAASDSSPLRRPSGDKKARGVEGQFLPWSEEFDLARDPSDKSYSAILPIAEPRALPPGVTLNQGLRIELTAYEENTQVDSTSLEVQILDDPAEQQNALPDHGLLRQVANQSGGTVLKDANDLAAMLESLPRRVAPSDVRTTPAWSVWWLLALLIVLLTVEWVWRRRLGMA
jgi:uncharacterized membrane protein